MAEIERLRPEAAAFTAFRPLQNGRGRVYTITESTGGWSHLEQFIRQCRYTGQLVPPSADDYAVLDVLDANDDIIQDYGIPNARAWRWVKRKLRFVVSTSGSEGEDR